MKQRKLIGIFGGTFDPIHYGHLRTALEIYQNLDLAEIRFIPCKKPVHKPEAQATPEQRLAMLQLAVSGQKGFVVDDRELKRETPSYMFYTLESLRRDFPDDLLLLIVGKDSLCSLDTWFRWQDLLSLCHIIAIDRLECVKQPQNKIKELIEQRQVADIKQLTRSQAGHILFLPTTHLNISATLIRESIYRQISPKYLLPEAVFHYIQQHKIYNEL